jgi:hypothetical protein
MRGPYNILESLYFEGTLYEEGLSMSKFACTELSLHKEKEEPEEEEAAERRTHLSLRSICSTSRVTGTPHANTLRKK